MWMRIDCLKRQLNSSQPIHIVWSTIEFDWCASCCSFANNISTFYSQRCLNGRTLIFDLVHKCKQFFVCFFWNADSNIDCVCSEISSQHSSSILHCIVERFKINLSQIVRIAAHNSDCCSIGKIISIEWKCRISRHYQCVVSLSK